MKCPSSLFMHVDRLSAVIIRTARRGMWKNGVNIETPSEYKKRYAVALGGKEMSESSTEKDNKGDDKQRFLSRLRTMLRQ